MSFLDRLFRIDERSFKKIERKAKPVLALEDDFRALSDDELRGKTVEFRKMLADGKTIDDILPPAFATAREAGRRVLGQFPYPVQVFGSTVLNEGDVAEMKTGEVQSVLVSILVIISSALTGQVKLKSASLFGSGTERRAIRKESVVIKKSLPEEARTLMPV